MTSGPAGSTWPPWPGQRRHPRWRLSPACWIEQPRPGLSPDAGGAPGNAGLAGLLAGGEGRALDRTSAMTSANGSNLPNGSWWEIAAGLSAMRMAMTHRHGLVDELDLSARRGSGLAAPARETLVSPYRPMVRGLAGRYQVPPQQREDLVQVGYVGLMKAINSFDPSIRDELKPYARICADGEMKRYFRDKRWLIRVSRTDQELLLAARKTQAELAGELGATPTDEQRADRRRRRVGGTQ